MQIENTTQKASIFHMKCTDLSFSPPSLSFQRLARTCAHSCKWTFHNRQMYIYILIYLDIEEMNLERKGFHKTTIVHESVKVNQGTRSSKDDCSTGDQTIILGLHILLDHKSSGTTDQKL